MSLLVCATCANFRTNPRSPDDPAMGLCAKYQATNRITGETQHDWACLARYDLTRCGPTARYYEPNPHHAAASPEASLPESVPHDAVDGLAVAKGAPDAA